MAQLSTPGRFRAPFAAVVACLALAACQPGSIAGPTTASSHGPGATPAATIAGQASGAVDIALADALRDATDPDAIIADLRQLESIADAHGGTRAAGSPGHEASASFVAGELRAAGYQVEEQSVDVYAFEQTGRSTLEIVGAGARAFDDEHDFKAMLFSPSADVTAPMYALGFDPGAQPGDSGGLGCSPGDWTGVPAGAIVLVQPGNCFRHDVVVQAQIAGAAGLVTAYPGWIRDAVLRPTLIEPADIHIPVIGTTQAVGVALAEAAGAGASAHIATSTSSEKKSSVNVIAETPWGDPQHVVMVGGHLDSVVDGPGINDDGSGAMTVLSIARALARTAPPASAWKVRFAFWTGEEIGLVGSTAWVGRSGAEPLNTVAAYVNLDMLGSPNGGRYVYDGAVTSSPPESEAIDRLFARALDADGLAWEKIQVGSSDNVSFDRFGIPTGGLFSGANEIKSAGQASTFGGTADAPEDPCFHLACDRVAGIDRTLLRELARAAAWGVGALTSGEVQLVGS